MTDLTANLDQEELAAFTLAQRAEFANRFRSSARSTGLVAIGISLACLGYLPLTWAYWGLALGAFMGTSLLAYHSVAHRLDEERLAPLMQQGLGVTGAAMAGHAAISGNGFNSLACLLLVIFWLYGTVVVPNEPQMLLAGILSQAAAFALPMVLESAYSGVALWSLVILGGGGAMVQACRQRFAAEAQMFVAQRRNQTTQARLLAHNAQLADSANELERRVDEQLGNVLARRRRLQQMQRTLASQADPRAVPQARLDEPSSDQGLPRGTLLGGRARILRPLSSGGFGDIYLAEDQVIGGEVVAKVMRVDVDATAHRKKRFVMEAAVASAVRHPAVIQIYDVGLSADGRPYLLCERIRGFNLRVCIESNALDAPEVVGVFQLAAEALMAVHAAGIVHRDVKPENLMLHPESPGLKLLDFGVSRWAAHDGLDLTEAGELVGTVAYMAPEQIQASHDSAHVTAAADVYALGLSLFECLAGEHPLAGKSAVQMVRAHIAGDLPKLKQRGPLLDHRLCALVDRMLKLAPAERPTLPDVHEALGNIGALPPRPDVTYKRLAKQLGGLSPERALQEDSVVTAEGPLPVDAIEPPPT